MNHYYVSLLIFCLVSITSFGQSSKAKKLYEKGEKAVSERQFPDAKEYLNKSIKADPSFGDSYYLLAYLNILERDYQRSRELYAELMKCCANNAKYMLAHLSLAEYEWSQGNYDLAEKYATSFLKFNPSKRQYSQISTANKIIASCKYARINIENKLPFNPTTLGSTVNSREQQYFPAITANGTVLYFTARDRKTDENIYQTTLVDGEWATPEEVRELNTKYNEGTCSISADGSIMIFTSCESTRDRQGYGSCDLFLSKKIGEHWTKPENLGPNVNSRNWESQPSLSADGRTLYFVSDRKGGVGKKDIWVSKLGSNGDWNPAQNLGENINSYDDDLSPYIHSNGTTLYFSSEGQVGYGGLDLFKVEFINGQWTTPKNLGFPINDHADQVSLIVSSDGSKGYFSKEFTINGNERTSEIVSFDVPKDIQPSALSSYLEGVVYNAITKKPLKSEIELKKLESDITESKVFSDEETGKYLIVLNQEEEYALYVSRPGYLFQSLTFDMHNVGVEGKTLDIFLQRVEHGINITLNNIFFDSNKFDLEDKSNVELQRIIEFMQNNPTLKVEISGHTDNIGTDKYNVDLSQKRAEAVVNYLIDKGVPKSNLVAKGYGKSKPVASNDTELGRQKNRRIEFEIL
ncbi:OmpA family protein [Flammeovirga kamogawensis]|uniref:OmpA family protein n=1 Tax=Flammeovirga kamogawensis TaxID=373891 RepID=A0ABX8GX15_9BACT|nr:OmpA family protein [Flammeovirga kamogawensis]MBB6461311.1 outer membrane protein OmpA-like peptidoglycan-associated protein/tetratricopeptide (TPR) repeat protein [Flammeovirga kamogawensis]QWG07868.1 OmpA family protein [Flammeovirga kamogawensis]TRX69675.1 OmpA family protein [Flammeovirga kamogawensis]